MAAPPGALVMLSSVLPFTDFRNHAKDYFDAVEAGDTVRVFRNGKPIADIVPTDPAYPPGNGRRSPHGEGRVTESGGVARPEPVAVRVFLDTSAFAKRDIAGRPIAA
jgi:prevent-host-death family protein